MSVFTKVGSSIWMWPPFRQLARGPDDVIGPCAQLLYLHLYTAPEAKASVPGLYQSASVNTIAESMGAPADDVRRWLDRLVEDDLVEFDVQHRVLRILLPDAGESPTNGNTIRGWWRKFNNVPACPTRDAHVPMLWWLMEEWSRSNDKPISADHMKAWSETFGRLTVPKRRVRARKHVQTSLFDSPESLPETLPTDELSTDRGEIQQSAASDLRSNKINNSETLSEGFPKEREKDPEQDRDQDLLSSLGGGQRSAAVRDLHGAAPRLRLVPPPPPEPVVPPPPAPPPVADSDVLDLLATLCEGFELDQRHAEVREGTQASLQRAGGEVAAMNATRSEVLAMGAWGRARCELGRVPGDPRSKVSAWAAIPGMLRAALKAVRDRARQQADVQDQLDAIKRGVVVPT